MRIPRAVLFILAIASAACGGAGADRPTDAVAVEPPTPAMRCEALQARRLPGDRVRLVAAFESTALEIAAWHESGRVPGGGRAGAGQSPLRSYPAAESIASCYFDGSFTYRGHLPAGGTPPVFERMLFLVDGAGLILQESGGTKMLYPLVRPAA